MSLSIGAATSVFSVVNAVLLKPFAFRDADRLLVVRETEDKAGSGREIVPDNYRHFLYLKENAKTLEDAAIFRHSAGSISPNGDHPRVVGTVITSPNLFRLLGVRPMLGRNFVDADARKGAAHIVVLSYEGWREFFSGDSNVIGKTLRINGEPNTVIGVLPPGMHFPQVALSPKIHFQELGQNVMLYEPFVPAERDLKNDTGNFNYSVIARLNPGVTVPQAHAELGALLSSYTVSSHLPVRFGIAIAPLAQDVASGVRGGLWLLFAAVGAVLLIACVNLANLQFARAVSAEHETAVRAALGASRSRQIMARLTESLILAVIGGMAGIALAFLGVRMLLALVPANIPRLEEVRISVPVLLFAVALSMLVAIAFGILPALRSLRVPPHAALQTNSSRTANVRDGQRMRNIMVAAQLTCTVVLLIVTALSLRSFSHLMHQNRGFDASHVTVAGVDLFAPQYGDFSSKNPQPVKQAFADRALAALRQLPGVESSALTSATPLKGETWVDYLHRPDRPLPDGQEPLVNVRFIDPDYLPTMRIPVVAGRNISAGDRGDPYVALISERTAREAFPGEDPIGRKIGSLAPDSDHLFTVVGVVADTRINGLKDTAAMAYAPYWVFTHWTLSFLVRSSQPSDVLIPEMRRVLWQVDPQVAIPVLKSMDEQVSESAATDRFQAIVLSGFGISALLLALLGVYGVLAYSVSLRQQEFGIRIALGSGKGSMVGLVLRQAAYPVLFGTAAGLAISFVVLRWVRSLLYQTPVMDPLAISGSVLLLLAVSATAAMIPAYRAASVDPMRALRSE
ncbi:MAG: hypothetical protein BGO25_03705 [Acidobacteriales bacterium 59-55]|nr:MAG: hypothetical protein BGO25_03705 [Acidobacteriales bacterium 59-55]